MERTNRPAPSRACREQEPKSRSPMRPGWLRTSAARAVRLATAQRLRWTFTCTPRVETRFVTALPLRKTTICCTTGACRPPAAGSATTVAKATAAAHTSAALWDRRDRIDLNRPAADGLEPQPVGPGRPPRRLEQHRAEARSAPQAYDPPVPVDAHAEPPALRQPATDQRHGASVEPQARASPLAPRTDHGPPPGALALEPLPPVRDSQEPTVTVVHRQDDAAPHEGAPVPGAVHAAHPELVGSAGSASEMGPRQHRVLRELPPGPGGGAAHTVGQLPDLRVVGGDAASDRAVVPLPVDPDGARPRAVARQTSGEGEPEAWRGAVEGRAGGGAGRVDAHGQGVRTDRVRPLGFEPVDPLRGELDARPSIRPRESARD